MPILTYRNLVKLSIKSRDHGVDSPHVKPPLHSDDTTFDYPRIWSRAAAATNASQAELWVEASATAKGPDQRIPR